mmetsp:Transcript_117180/g.373247  ORF Transcript_117180/g.373247 Transcript_117180/m.373247 type:complete len:217 (+) Transcript_117180:1485-2135(+)
MAWSKRPVVHLAPVAPPTAKKARPRATVNIEYITRRRHPGFAAASRPRTPVVLEFPSQDVVVPSLIFPIFLLASSDNNEWWASSASASCSSTTAAGGPDILIASPRISPLALAQRRLPPPSEAPGCQTREPPNRRPTSTSSLRRWASCSPSIRTTPRRASCVSLADSVCSSTAACSAWCWWATSDSSSWLRFVAPARREAVCRCSWRSRARSNSCA